LGFQENGSINAGKKCRERKREGKKERERERKKEERLFFF